MEIARISKIFIFLVATDILNLNTFYEKSTYDVRHNSWNPS